MPTFQYSGLDDTGQPVNGSVIGGDIQQAMKTLENRGLKVDKIEVMRLINDPMSSSTGGQTGFNPPNNAAPSSPGPFAPHPRVAATSDQPTSSPAGIETPKPPAANYPGPGNFPPTGPYNPADRSYLSTNVLGPLLLKAPLHQLGFYFRQLSTMMKAGVPIVHACQTLQTQANDPRMKAMAGSVSEAVRAGRQISEGLRRHPETVSPVLIAIIQVGEKAGFVDDALAQASEYVAREVELRSLYRRMTFYPKLIFFSSFIVIGAANSILSVVAPEAPGIMLPFGLGTWIVIAATLLGIWIFLRVGLQNRSVKASYDRIVLKIPVMGKTMHEIAMAKFGRAFGAMNKAGVPVGEAMRLAAAACGNEALLQQMEPYFRTLDNGAGILQTFQMTGAFSPIVLDMIATGETTGNIDEMLSKVAQYYEEETVTKQMAVAAIVGVFCFLCVAVYIGYIIINFYTGYFGNIMQAANSESFIRGSFIR